MILVRDLEFAEGLGLEVQIRTKLVRFWSHIKSAVIRIGDDILELEGAVATVGGHSVKKKQDDSNSFGSTFVVRESSL